MTLLGTAGRIDVEIPFNAPTNKPLSLTISNGMELMGGTREVEMIPAADQYTIQGDAFSRAIRENKEVPVPLEDAIANMRVIDAIFRSAESGKWEKP
jgi:predicted dehydrogenase